MSTKIHRTPRGFTLLELLVSVAILGVLTTLLFAAFNQASKAWQQAENRVETFQDARAALDFMSKELSQALCTSNIQFLANPNSLAFVAPVGNAAVDGSDLVKIVYRLNYMQVPGGLDDGTGANNGPPQKLLRRISTFASDPADCWDYGLAKPCAGVVSPWNFYRGTADWPEKSDKSKTQVLAENIVSLDFQFTLTNDLSAAESVTNYWISTSTTPVWTHEMLGGGIGLNFQSTNQAALMVNHAPIGVQITIGAIDSRAANRIHSISDAFVKGFVAANGRTPYASELSGAPMYAAYTNIINNSVQYFTTYVAIPNNHP